MALGGRVLVWLVMLVIGLRLAIEVYRLTSRYDGAITAYLAAQAGLPS